MRDVVKVLRWRASCSSADPKGVSTDHSHTESNNTRGRDGMETKDKNFDLANAPTRTLRTAMFRLVSVGRLARVGHKDCTNAAVTAARGLECGI